MVEYLLEGIIAVRVQYEDRHRSEIELEFMRREVGAERRIVCLNLNLID